MIDNNVEVKKSKSKPENNSDSVLYTCWHSITRTIISKWIFSSSNKHALQGNDKAKTEFPKK